MTGETPLEARVTELEIQLELRAELVRELNDVVIEQGRELGVLRLRVDELETRASAQVADERPDPKDESPPHY
jgi:uncharacterized coiled-coil protein SlyX